MDQHRTFSASLLLALLAALCCPLAAQESTPTNASVVLYEIKPSDTDPAIRHFDEPDLVLFETETPSSAELVVFMPGTDGQPAHARKLLRVVAGQGYRVIGLEYDDSPAVVEVCPRDPSPRCSEDFRRRRIFGETDARVVDNPPAESIVNRLVKLLQYLARVHPGEGWESYLAGEEPAWDCIVVSGLSQGAGMAAYIAKRVTVARVVLFSSPWDYSALNRTLAPWLAANSATPPERWYAAYHRREKTADLLARAYVVLGIPRDHVLIFDCGLPPGERSGRSNNPYHGSTVRNAEYAPQWRMLFGHSRADDSKGSKGPLSSSTTGCASDTRGGP
jgi:hypothetical protein